MKMKMKKVLLLMIMFTSFLLSSSIANANVVWLFIAPSAEANYGIYTITPNAQYKFDYEDSANDVNYTATKVLNQFGYNGMFCDEMTMTLRNIDKNEYSGTGEIYAYIKLRVPGTNDMEMTTRHWFVSKDVITHKQIVEQSDTDVVNYYSNYYHQ